MTMDRSAGVFARIAWGNGDILGWVTDVLKPDGNDSPRS